MRKLAVWFLALSAALLMTACGAGSTAGPSTAPEQSAAPAAETAAPGDTAADENVAQADTPSAPGTRELGETTVIDNELCTVTVTGLEEDRIWGVQLKLRLENHSADKTYMFSLSDMAVNGVAADALCAETVAPGKKSNTSVTIFGSDFDMDDIGGLTDIWLSFRVYDSDDWLADDAGSTEVHLYPYGEENAVRYEREPQPGDIVLAEADGASVIMTGTNGGGLLGGYGVELYLINATDKDLTFSANDVSVNGYMVDPFWAKSIGAGQVGFSEMTWFKSGFEENGITEVEEIELRLRIYDSNDWFADDVFNDVITITPQK